MQDDEDLKVPQLQRIHLAKVPIVSIYSSKLLPKPADYDELEHIVGPLFSELDIKGKTPQEEGYVMPVALAEYIEQAKRDGVPLAYVGIGSMLGTLFDEDEITKILNHISEGAIMAQSELACRVLIHTTTGNPEPGKITYQPPDALKSAFFAIGTSIPHRHLLPHCAFIVTHGGETGINLFTIDYYDRGGLHAGCLVGGQAVIRNSMLLNVRSTLLGISFRTA